MSFPQAVLQKLMYEKRWNQLERKIMQKLRRMRWKKCYVERQPKINCAEDKLDVAWQEALLVQCILG